MYVCIYMYVCVCDGDVWACMCACECMCVCVVGRVWARVIWTVTERSALWDDGHPSNGLRVPGLADFPGLCTHLGKGLRAERVTGLGLQAELG